LKPRRGAEELKVDIHFPTRVDTACCKLQLSRARQELILVVP
jgi:hypothetical protein